MPLPQDLLRPFFATPCYDTGLDAMELLAKQIMLDVQNLMNTPLREGRYLLQSLHATFTEGLAIILRLMNMTVPINRIPPELLTHIFALSPERLWQSKMPVDCNFEEISVSDLHKLPKVCRYWRDLALATPTLWTTVSIHTFRTTDGHEQSLFRRSAYLPDDSSVGLVVHCTDVGHASKNSREKMTKFLLANAPRLRELHVWSTSAIQDFPLFLQSFDATTLEHFTLSSNGRWSDWELSHKAGIMPLFCSVGSRLRSLSLDAGLETLPSNEFPALTQLSISVKSPFSVVRWDVSDLVKFLAGSPRLEEVHVRHLQSEPQHLSSPPRSPGPNAPIALPRLQYLSFKCNESKIIELVPAQADPIEYLLSHVSIPSACHISFGVVRARTSNCVINRTILDSVRRHVDGKNEVFHVFLDLSCQCRGVQLVFCEGSLHLETFDSAFGSPAADFFAGLFNPYPELIARMIDVRILDDSVATVSDHASLLTSSESLHAIFPNITTLVLIRDCVQDKILFDDVPEGLDTVRQGFDHAVVPKRPQSDSKLDVNNDQRSIPWPALDTFWTFVRSWGDIANLEAMLVARATLGCPIRCVVITVYYGTSQKNAEDVSARLRTLSADEVILTQIVVDGYGGCDFEPINWMAKFPERFSLPSTIRRDWPTMW